jgi:hypothetical protein
MSLRVEVWVIIADTVIDMNESRLNTVAQLRAFLEETLEVQFYPLNSDTQRYAFINTLLQRLATLPWGAQTRA